MILNTLYTVLYYSLEDNNDRYKKIRVESDNGVRRYHR